MPEVSMSDNRERLERMFELLVYAPIGAGLYLREAAPPIVESIVARGRAEFDRRQEEVHRHFVSTRSLGQVALAFGLPRLRSRVEDMVSRRFAPAESADSASPEASAPESLAAPMTAAPAASISAPGAETMPQPVPRQPAVGRVVDGPGREELPIPGYDALSASQVVERLAGLGPAELDAVHAYETAHRHRRTILGKIEQLAG
jgi:hypothetical protein